MKINSFHQALNLFHAQSLLGSISMSLPFESKFDVVREKIFDCSMKLIEISNLLNDLNNSSES